MDLDKAFVAALLASGAEGLRQSMVRGVTTELLAGDGQRAYGFVLEYFRQYGGLPSQAVVDGVCGVELEKPQEPVEFFVEQVLQRRLHGKLRGALQETVKHLEVNETIEAFEVFQQKAYELRADSGEQAKTVPISAYGDSVLEWYRRIQSGERGILTPWLTMNECTYGFWPEDFILIVARLGVGKCVHESTLIQDPVTGQRRTIRELVEDDGATRVLTWSKEKGVHAAGITAKHDTGRKACLRFVLESGREVVVTPEHPFLTGAGWQRADRLAPWDTVAVAGRLPWPEKPVIGAADAFDGQSERMPERNFRVGKVAFRDACRAAWSKMGRLGEDGIPSFEAAHRGLLEDLQHLLLRFGVRTQLVDGRKWYTLRVRAESIATFSEELVTVRVPEDARQGETGPSISTTFAGEIMDRFGFELFGCGNAVLQQRYERDGLDFSTIVRMGCDCGGEFIERELDSEGEIVWRCGCGLLLQPGVPRYCKLNLQLFEVFCDCVGWKGHEWMSDPSIAWDRIVDVERVGEQKIYDLTVEPTSCFVANDVVVHNTWALLKMAHYAHKEQGRRVLLVTTEMSQQALALRWAALEALVSYGDLRHGRLGVFQEKKLEEALEAAKADKDLQIVGGNFDFRIETLDAIVADSDAEVVFVDGLYLLKTEGANRLERAANIFDEIKRIGKRRKRPLVGSTQFNREVKTGSKAASMESEKIAQTDVAGWNADQIFALWQTKEMRADNRMGWHPMKVREGVGKDWETKWDLEAMNFAEVESAMGDMEGEEGSAPAVGAAATPEDFNALF